LFERFTERARQVVVLAQDEARALKHNYIGTEHILLGLLREEKGLAARALESFDITVEEVRTQVERVIGKGDSEILSGQIPFTPRAKKVLELALREALSLHHNYIGPEHILLGIVRVNEGVAARIMLDFGADADRVRSNVVGMLGGTAPPVDPALREELERVQAEKEAAIEGQAFDKAADLRERQRRLEQQLAEGAEGIFHGPVTQYAAPSPPKTVGAFPFVVGWLLFGVSLGLGVLVGWVIWGL
jgi:ClpA/ClpB-like protein